MSREFKTLRSIIQHLVNTSDHLESIRSKIKNSRLLNGQKGLVTVIEELKAVEEQITKENQKKRQQLQADQADEMERLEKWKKEQEKHLLTNYYLQKQVVEKDLKGNLKKQSMDMLRKRYYSDLDKIKSMYEDAIRGAF